MSGRINLDLSQVKQECIPVGCVPSATVAVCWGGVPDPGGGGCAWSGGVPGATGVGIPACTEADPPVDRQV